MNHLNGHVPLGFHSVGPDMGGCYHLVSGEEPPDQVLLGRLDAVNIDSQPGDLSRRQPVEKASSSMIPPRAQLMRRTPFFIRAISPAPIMPLVSSGRGV